MPPFRPAAPARALVLTLVMGAPVAAQVPSKAEVEKGRQIFEQMKCLLCHSLEGKGGKLDAPHRQIGAGPSFGLLPACRVRL